jgi:transcriptional regulator GlxA family with amidase domain
MIRTKIVFLVLPRVHLLDLSGAVQVFLEAKDLGAPIDLEYCSLGDEVISSAGLPLGKLKHFRELDFRPGDYLFVPGSEVDFLVSKQMTSQRDLIQWVRDVHTMGAYVCSICSGAFFLALTGILNGRKCTTHWKRTEELQRRFPNIHVLEDILFAEDQKVFTSAGVTAGVDLALHILSRLTNEKLSYQVARELVVYLRRSGSASQQSVFMQYRNHIHSGIHKAQDYVHENIRKRVTLEQLADKACMSPRNLTRIFKRETGITVNEYTNLIRKEMLREFMKDPDMSRKQMAKACGLSSERHVIRLLNSF